MHSNENIFTEAKTVSLKTVEDMAKFAVGMYDREEKRPHDISPYVDYDKGWKFTEDDKVFLIAFYEDWIQGCIENFDGDFIEEPTEILNSLKEKGIVASKDLIQENARELADVVCDDIYQYYVDSPNILKLIENSILDVQWWEGMRMNDLAKIGNEKISVIEWKDQRVITTALLAEAYETSTDNVKMNFNRHKDNFIEGKHYFLLQGEELREFKSKVTDSYPVKSNVNQLYLWTERGANRHCKILDTDKAWEQFDHLEETYFKVKEFSNEIPKDYPSALRLAADEYEKRLLAEQKNGILQKENDLLSQKTLEWADRPIINALVRAYGHGIGDDYATAWRDFKKELLYRYSINLNARQTAHLNAGGSKKKKKLDFLNDEELPQAISTAVAMCREAGIDISDIIEKQSE